MPRLTIDHSLFEPVEVVIGERVLRAVPLTARLIRDMTDISKGKDNSGDKMESTVRMAALIFGISPDDVRDNIDVRAIAPAIEFVTRQMEEAAKSEKVAAGFDDRDKGNPVVIAAPKPETDDDRKNG